KHHVRAAAAAQPIVLVLLNCEVGRDEAVIRITDDRYGVRRDGLDDVRKGIRIVVVLVENGAVRESAGLYPFLAELELGSLGRFAIGQGPQVVDVTENALQLDVPGFGWPRDDDPHRIRLLLQSNGPRPLKFRATYRLPKAVHTSERADFRSGSGRV